MTSGIKKKKKSKRPKSGFFSWILHIEIFLFFQIVNWQNATLAEYTTLNLSSQKKSPINSTSHLLFSIKNSLSTSIDQYPTFLLLLLERKEHLVTQN